MSSLFTVLLWLLGLGVALYAAEKLVHYLTLAGEELHISTGLLSALVALGADAPEVTSALIALSRGASDVGLGVVVGSNIYNLAGLLGMSSVLAGRIGTDRYRLSLDGGSNVILTLLLIGLVMLPALHVALGAMSLVVLGLYAVAVSLGRTRVLALLGRLPAPAEPPERAPDAPPTAPRLPITIGLAVLSAVFIVVGSDLLVNTSISLGHDLGIPSDIVGTFVLAIATSLPNTWAAISLARRGLGGAAVATTFNSNSINIALGAGLPSLFLSLHAPTAARVLDAPWLLGVTAVALVLLASRWAITRVEGIVLLALYAAFVTIRLLIFG